MPDTYDLGREDGDRHTTALYVLDRGKITRVGEVYSVRFTVRVVLWTMPISWLALLAFVETLNRQN